MINDDIAARIAAKADRDETPTLPWLQPATVDPDWLTEARNHLRREYEDLGQEYEGHIAATREPFTHPLWDVSAA